MWLKERCRTIADHCRTHPLAVTLDVTRRGHGTVSNKVQNPYHGFVCFQLGVVSEFRKKNKHKNNVFPSTVS